MTGIILNSMQQIHQLFKEQYFADFFVHRIKGRKFYVVKAISGEMFVLTFCGQQVYEVAACTAHLITNFNLTDVIYIGTGENCNFQMDDYDLLLATQVVVHQPKNQHYKKYPTYDKYNELIKKTLMVQNLNFVQGEVYEEYYGGSINPLIASVRDNASAPIAATCHFYEIPCAFVIIKKSYDSSELAHLIDNLTYNIIQEISYDHLKQQAEEQ